MRDLSWDTLPKFIEQIRDVPRNISEKAIAILWYRSHCKGLPHEGLMPTELARLMEEHQLYLAQKTLPELNALSQGSSYVIMAASKGGLIINYPARKALDERYTQLIDRPPELAVSNELITDVDIVEASSFGILFHELIRQANICCELHLLDACALVCRRLFELLLIRSFEANGMETEIQGNNGEGFVGLGSIIGKAKSGNYFPLHKDTKKLLDSVHGLGNDAAHSQFIVIKKSHIDAIKPLMDKALSELLDRAKIQRNMKR